MIVIPVGAPVRPRCWNRGAFADPRAGWHPTGKMAVGSHRRFGAAPKYVLRYRWPWFENKCATWEGLGIGQPTEQYPTGTPYPIAHNFDCEGCRWKPQR